MHLRDMQKTLTFSLCTNLNFSHVFIRNHYHLGKFNLWFRAVLGVAKTVERKSAGQRTKQLRLSFNANFYRFANFS